MLHGWYPREARTSDLLLRTQGRTNIQRLSANANNSSLLRNVASKQRLRQLSAINASNASMHRWAQKWAQFIHRGTRSRRLAEPPSLVAMTARGGYPFAALCAVGPSRKAARPDATSETTGITVLRRVRSRTSRTRRLGPTSTKRRPELLVTEV